MLEPEPEPKAAIFNFSEYVFMPTSLVKLGFWDKQKKVRQTKA